MDLAKKELINIDEVNEVIGDIETPKIEINNEKIKSWRQSLFDKFGKNNPDLQKIGVLWSDVDQEKRNSKSVDELFGSVQKNNNNQSVSLSDENINLDTEPEPEGDEP